MEDTKLVAEFIEDNYEQFQQWLESKHEIEGTEAELILKRLEDETSR